MPQIQLPFFPEGVTEVNTHLAFIREGDTVTYVYGHLPIFSHHVDDIQTFRMITSQIYINGNAKQAELSRAFGITAINLKRSVKVYRKKGVAGFYEDRQRRGPAVLTESILQRAQQLLDEGCEISEVADTLGLKKDTLRKAVNAGRLHKALKKNDTISVPTTTKSARSLEDSDAPMGMGATNTLQRIAASLGKFDTVEPVFTASLDVPNAGVLFALPALIVSGLLSHADKYFQLPRGYYRLDSIFMLLAFMALARIKTIEDLRYCSPGEWGKILGMDRIPEAKTLRHKIGLLSHQDSPSKWAAELSRQWMQNEPDSAAILYIDGHVRVYSGNKTKLPQHYVAREKLCLRATVDYWVNAMDGQPFFMVTKEVDPGLMHVLEEEIIVRLEAEVPKQPVQQQLESDRYLHRFTVIFDREGYSPKLFQRLKDEKRIACLSYHKYPAADWAEAEFTCYETRLGSGNMVKMKLAERGTLLGNIIWVREIRKLTDSGHQTSIVSTDYKSDLTKIAAAMFSRWTQENYFKYMRQHYNLDRLIDYSTEAIADTIRVINPQYRRLDGEVRKKAGLQHMQQAKFGALTLKDDIDPEKVEAYQQKKAELQDDILYRADEIELLKQQRKAVRKYITAAELPEEERFKRLGVQSKYLIDTIKMIAYRAETAMTSVLREKMSHRDEARSLLRAIYSSEADILPDQNNSTLTIRLHQLANHCSGDIIRYLCNELNATELHFPGTNLRLVYELVST